MKKTKFDEKQLLDRGKAYRNGLIAAFISMIVYLLGEETVAAIDTYHCIMICIWITISVTLITMIVKNAYDGVTETPGIIIFAIFGICGIIITVCITIMCATGSETIFNKISQLFSGLCMIVTSIIYWIVFYRNSKKYKENE